MHRDFHSKTLNQLTYNTWVTEELKKKKELGSVLLVPAQRMLTTSKVQLLAVIWDPMSLFGEKHWFCSDSPPDSRSIAMRQQSHVDGVSVLKHLDTYSKYPALQCIASQRTLSMTLLQNTQNKRLLCLKHRAILKSSQRPPKSRVFVHLLIDDFHGMSETRIDSFFCFIKSSKCFQLQVGNENCGIIMGLTWPYLIPHIMDSFW